jgi:hypothetical protein
VKRVLVISAACALIGAVVLIVCLSGRKEPKEPVYEGKKLSQWIQAYNESLRGRGDVMTARKAIRAIGTNGLPCLVKWIAYEPPRWRGLMGKIKARFPKFAPFAASEAREERARHAAQAFEALRSLAVPAFPQLEKAFYDTENPWTRNQILEAFDKTGRSGRGLGRALSQQNYTQQPVRYPRIVHIPSVDLGPVNPKIDTNYYYPVIMGRFAEMSSDEKLSILNLLAFQVKEEEFHISVMSVGLTDRVEEVGISATNLAAALRDFGVCE